MKWWAKRANQDESFEFRLDRLKRDLALCEPTVKHKDTHKCLEELIKRLESVATPSQSSISSIQSGEADLCLLVPKAMLFPIAQRLKDKLYRLDKGQKEAWINEIQLIASDPSTIEEEKEETVRLRLRFLTNEIADASASFSRVGRERARVFRLLLFECAFLICLYSIVVYYALGNLKFPDGGKELLKNFLWPVALAGGIGATISALLALKQEKTRTSQKWILFTNILVRSLLGFVYAGFVLAALDGGVLPLSIKSEGGVAFLLALGFVSGLSDQMFGQAVSRFIETGRSEDTSKTVTK